MQERRRQRTLWIAAAAGAAVLHLTLLVVLRPDPHLDYTVPEAREAIQITLVRPSRPAETPDDAPRTPATREAVAPFRDRASLPATAADGPAPPRRQPSTPAPAGLPAAPGSDLRPGANWSLTDPPDGALRKALRRSVGCDYGLRLTREEQAACDERFGRGRLKETPPLRATADRRRARELDAEGERVLKLHEYKRQPPPDGTFDDLRDMGGQPPA